MDSERGGVCNPAANVLGEITPSDMAQNLSQRSPDVAALRHNPGRQCLTQSVLWFVASSPDGTKWNPGFYIATFPDSASLHPGYNCIAYSPIPFNKPQTG